MQYPCDASQLTLRSSRPRPRRLMSLALVLAGVAGCESNGNPAALGADPASTPAAAVTANAVTTTRLAMTVGASQQLQASGRTKRARIVTWSTTNAAIATVSNSGLVRAVAAGEATVTASGGNASDVWIITVSAANPPPPPPPTGGALGLNANLGRALFPADNPWNQPVDTAQVDADSGRYHRDRATMSFIRTSAPATTAVRSAFRTSS